jgi:diacylglycerol kinase (CTP)
VRALPARPRATDGGGAGFFTLWLWRGGSARRVVLALSGALGVIAPVDAVRLRAPRFARFYERCLGFLMRESEKVCTQGQERKERG